MSENRPTSFTCPLPIDQYPTVTLPHGGGGKLMNQLISEMFLKAFQPDETVQPHDGAVNFLGDSRFAFTTDSYVVRPLFFPGGDIGSLAVHGTVNDLAVSGAVPRYLTLNAIIEEGLEVALLNRLVESAARAAREAGVRIVAGDTKVTPRGSGGGLYLATTGIGERDPGLALGLDRIRPGDAVLVSGPVGAHGTAIQVAQRLVAHDGGDQAGV